MSWDNIGRVGNLSGFGPVYIADRKRVKAYREYNFDLEGCMAVAPFG